MTTTTSQNRPLETPLVLRFVTWGSRSRTGQAGIVYPQQKQYGISLSHTPNSRTTTSKSDTVRASIWPPPPGGWLGQLPSRASGNLRNRGPILPLDTAMDIFIVITFAVQVHSPPTRLVFRFLVFSHRLYKLIPSAYSSIFIWIDHHF